jgi:mono/diheme cytochrome c family protein
VAEKSISCSMPFLTPATGEAAMLKPYLLLSATILFAISAMPALGGAPQESTPATAATGQNPVKPTPESQAKAKSLYQIDCALCHGDNGNGKTDLAKSMGLTIGDWTDAKTLADQSDQQLFDIIRKGKDKMPPEVAARAKDDVVWNLIVYIRSFAK